MTAGNLRHSGRATTWRRLSMLIAALAILVANQPLTAATGRRLANDVTVREERGVYRVQARFTIAEPAAVALAVLTDYERIPRFMPQVKTSVVRERSAAGAVVEQEAVASVMMFSKRIYLLLEVEEGEHRVSFRDASGRSFSQYEGAWSLVEQNGATVVTYQLEAKPSFAVPDFLLKRLLKRDANEMIDRLRNEVASRHS